MNRLILLGNGFDLAHGLKTDYNNFILYYLKKVFNNARKNHSYEDELIEIKFDYPNYYQYELSISVDQLVEYFFENGILELIDKQQIVLPKSSDFVRNAFTVNIKLDFLRSILTECHSARWVDIENEYYETLKRNLMSRRRDKWKNELAELNEGMKYIISLLDEYLSNQPKPKQISGISNILFANILKEDVVIEPFPFDAKPVRTMIVNFNYTSTVENYITPSTPFNIEMNYIHGQLGAAANPIVFGYGDETDESYKNMEKWRHFGYYQYIKTFWYSRASNYFRLVRFIQSEPFQVFVLGHSCGTSDRTMLNMIFEHDFCKSIKLFYYQHENGNNFNRLIEDISVIFENKKMMREKIVPFSQSSPMPQII